MSNNRNNRYNKKTKTSPQTKTSSQTRPSLLVNDEDISSGEIFSQRKDEDSSSSERVSQRKEGTAQAAARRAREEAAREEAARRAREEAAREEAARRAREEAARRSREEAARRGEGAGIGVPAGYDSSAELIRAREEMAERIRARQEMAKLIIGREEAAKLSAENNADIQAGVVETRMQQFRSIRGDTVICAARKFSLWTLKFLLRSINYFLIAVNKRNSDVRKAIWDSAKGAIKRFLNYARDQLVRATDPDIIELFKNIKDNLKIEDSSLTMSICDNGLTLVKVIKDLFIEGIISFSSDAYYLTLEILKILDTKAPQMSEEEQSTAMLLLTLGVNSDEAADVAAEAERLTKREEMAMAAEDEWSNKRAAEEEMAAMAAEEEARLAAEEEARLAAEEEAIRAADEGEDTQEEIRSFDSQGSGYDTLPIGGKHHTRKHKKQNKSRKQMKHKKTKRHRKKTKKHLKKRNNKKQRKTRNRK
jgi:hypothetical protein